MSIRCSAEISTGTLDYETLPPSILRQCKCVKQRFKLHVSTSVCCLYKHNSETEPSSSIVYIYWFWSLLVQYIVCKYLNQFLANNLTSWSLQLLTSDENSLGWAAQKCWEKIGSKKLTDQSGYYVQWWQKQTEILVILQ